MQLPAPAYREYDFILAGGGMAGLSFAYYLSQSNLSSRRVLIIDRGIRNEQTFCYWNSDSGEFDFLAEKSWDSLYFHSARPSSLKIAIEPYSYRKINGNAWYTFIEAELGKYPNIHFLAAEIESITYQGLGSSVQTSAGDYYAIEKIIDSFSPFPCENNNPQHLKQHFLGWVVECNFNNFETDAAHLFDFRVAFGNECEFMYVLPTSPRKALFEYTFFSSTLREPDYYRDKIKSYLFAYYGLTDDDYLLKEEESGVIPMRNNPNKPENLYQKHLKIGTSGGFVKSTTGYSFYRTQKFCKDLVAGLEKGPSTSLVIPVNPWKIWLDEVFLQVLIDQKIAGSKVFESLFYNNKPALLLKFLQEETDWKEDLRLMWSVPTFPFVRAALKTIYRSIIN
ncbi:lycopene cyclase family protein [Aquirufa sp.]|jgi:lycopene beta-cyclase|uniref:lycopene cyclase family protein n=1 Tax=Aquirufa sp. TaxID=2676249 RepID=UPI0037849AD2